MVVIVRSVGNHSNRLFQNLHIEAFCLENNIPFFNATLFNMAKLFKFRYKYLLGFAITLFFKVTKHFTIIRYIDFNDSNRIEFYKQQLLRGRNRLMLVGGWEFRDFQAIAHHEEFLRKKYCIAKSNKNYFCICSKMKNYEVVLGVHIRRGDYKNWRNGIYFFEYSTYRRLIDDFVKLQDGKKVFVVYFSDERPHPSDIDCPVEYMISRNAYYIDYRLMGNCDYLIGPPSTFTPWASFIYQIPYLPITHPQQKICLTDFSICKG
jgi:hypothetical protein